MSFSYNKLKGKIIEMYGCQSAFAKAMGWSEKTLSLKLGGKVYWKQNDIIKAVELLNLSTHDIQEYFFMMKV